MTAMTVPLYDSTAIWLYTHSHNIH